MADDAARLQDQSAVNERRRVLEAPFVPKALGPPKGMSARRPPPFAPDHVPDAREHHDAFAGLSSSSPRKGHPGRRLSRRTLDDRGPRWHGTVMTELVI